jgi:hypothetical protein
VELAKAKYPGVQFGNKASLPTQELFDAYQLAVKCIGDLTACNRNNSLFAQVVWLLFVFIVMLFLFFSKEIKQQ